LSGMRAEQIARDNLGHSGHATAVQMSRAFCTCRTTLHHLSTDPDGVGGPA
jgi:hypothetical protein